MQPIKDIIDSQRDDELLRARTSTLLHIVNNANWRNVGGKLSVFLHKLRAFALQPSHHSEFLPYDQEPIRYTALYFGYTHFGYTSYLHCRFTLEYEEVNVNTSKRRIQKTGGNNPPIPHGIDFVRGSVYGIFSRGFVEFILTDPMAHDLLQWARKTYTPDEFYWATLHHTYHNPNIHTPGGYSGRSGTINNTTVVLTETYTAIFV